MYTACTTPTAPFYETDLALLAIVESMGIDLPCAALIGVSAALAATVACGLALAVYWLASRRAANIRDNIRWSRLNKRI